MADQRGKNVRFDVDTEDGCEWEGKRKRSDTTAGSLSLPWQKLMQGEGALRKAKRQSISVFPEFFLFLGGVRCEILSTSLTEKS